MLPLAVFSVLGAPDASRVLVIENTASPASVEVARDYMKRRKVRNLLTVVCQDSTVSVEKETIAYAEFNKAIETPLRDYLKKHPRIDIIVLTKGVPLRIDGAKIGMGGLMPSLDSYVAALDYADRKDTTRVSLDADWFKGQAYANRFWNSEERFSHAKFGGYLVSRLDGYTVEQAKGLTTLSLAAKKPTGAILLDTVLSHGVGDVARVPKTVVNVDDKGEVTLGELGYNEWDTDMVAASELLEKRRVPVILDKTDDFVGDKIGLMGYASWGSNDPKFVAANYLSLRFAPGAIAETAVSTSGRSFVGMKEGQSLIGDLIANGLTGAKGYVNEPLLTAVASPTILFDRYTRGWTMAESFFAASRFVGWEDIVIGDPLCSPYRR